jgi:predicted CxxxxCH...CXXCH cytochrome family protein
MTAISIKSLIIRQLTASNNTPIVATGTRLDTDTGVIMQRVQVTGSSAMELNSLTLDDSGTANTIASAQIWISPTSATTLPGDAVLVGSMTNWGGSSTQFPLTGGTTANRTLGGTQPASKYIYIVYDMSEGQATKSVQSKITAIGVVSPANGATGLNLSSNVITLAYSGNKLTTSAPLTGAINAKDSDVAVVMQHFKVDCDTAWDNSLELSSLTLQATGSATLVSAVKVYVSTTEDPDQTKLPSSAKQIGQFLDWDKSSTTIPLNDIFGTTAADRTVVPGTSKYLYVVFSMYYPDDADFLLNPNPTIQSQVTAVGTASPDIGSTGLTYLSNNLTLTRGTWSRITSCGGCHATEKLADSTTRNPDPVTGLFPGSHYGHNSKNGIDCSACHPRPVVYNHANGFINFSGYVRGGKYSQAPSDSLQVSNVDPKTFGTCSNTYCHGPASPVWGTSSTDDSCVKCHGVKGTTDPQYTADPNTSAPGYKGTGTSLTGATAATDARVGAHDTHLRVLSNAAHPITNPIACAECHTVPATVLAAGHIDNAYPSEVPMNGTLTRTLGVVPAYDFATGTCTNTYCHYGKPTGSSYTPAAANAAVVWTDTSYLGGTNADCQKCHLSPPSNTGNHKDKAFPGSCNTCHSHVDINGNITDPSLHINGIVNASGGHSFPYSGSSHLIDAGTTPWPTCSCHSTSATGVTYATWVASGTQGNRSAPNCTTCHLSGLNTPSGTSSCWDCHGATATDGTPNGASFPNLAGSHTKHVVGQNMACDRCHTGAGAGTAGHGNSNNVTRTTTDVTVASATSEFAFSWAGGTGKGTCSSVACHVNAEWGVTVLDCISCHAAPLTIKNGPLANGTNTRRAVSAELKNSTTRSHKGTAIGSDATKWDCVVCHLEGDYATGSPVLGIHGNGVIDFRDPDTGAQVKKVTWTGTGAAGAYVDTLTNFTTARFSRNLGATLENDPAWLNVATIQQNLCLHCHDSNGAINSTAWTKNASGTVVGTALRPFGLAVGSTSTYALGNGTIATTGGVAANIAAGGAVGNVMDVKSMFATANASYHPVIGKGNNGFTGTTMMKAPWNTATTPNAKVAKTNTVYGWLISCFDCHGAQGSTGVQTGTVVAHGNGTTTGLVAMRGVSGWNSTPNLCTVCHADQYNGTGHGTGSAFTVSDGNMSGRSASCSWCHGGGVNNIAIRAQDIHGVNSMINATGTATWGSGSKPYSFFRNTQNLSAWTMGASCSGNGPSGLCNNGMGSYTPGGFY